MKRNNETKPLNGLCEFDATSTQTSILETLKITEAMKFQNLYSKKDFVILFAVGPQLYLLPREYGLLSKLENY